MNDVQKLLVACFFWERCVDFTVLSDILKNLEAGPAPPEMYLQLVVNHGMNYEPQLLIAGFLNHQQYDSFK